MRNKIRIDQNNLLVLILAVSIFWIAMLAAGLHIYNSQISDIAGLMARSDDGAINLSWYCSGGEGGEYIELTIASDAGNDIVRLDKNAVSYSFTGGEHGRLYQFTVTAKNSDEEAGESQQIERLFLDWERLPGLPIIYVETENGELPTCDYAIATGGNWGGTAINNEYVSARFTMTRQGSATLDCGAKIRIRGNASSFENKKPYKVSLDQSVDLLGRDNDIYQDMEWLLLPIDYSLATLSGNKVAELCGLEWQPQFIPVSLCMNGDWMGCYLLMEPVAKGTGRVNISDTGFLIENDAYWWCADGQYFQTPYQNEHMGYTFKYPDPDDISQTMILQISNYIVAYEEALITGGDYTQYISLDSFAAWLLAQDVMGVWDSGGANMFLYKEDLNAGDLFSTEMKMGPLWDMSSAYAMKDDWARIHSSPLMHFDVLLQREEFREVYLQKWRSMSDTLVGEMECCMNDFLEAYGGDLQLSAQLDAARWRMDTSQFETVAADTHEWFTSRTQWLDQATLTLE